MWESTLVSDTSGIFARDDIFSPSTEGQKKTLSQVLEHRTLLISIINEFESDLKHTYGLENVAKTSVQRLQQEHLKLVQSLEEVEEYICSYDAKTKTEQRLVTLTILDIFTRLNNVDQSDYHIQALIDRINGL